MQAVVYIYVWYSVFYMHRYKESCRLKNVFDIDAYKTHYTIPVYRTVFMIMKPWFRNT
jgi:hypothetical protein